jgi:hypothetical protein
VHIFDSKKLWDRQEQKRQDVFYRVLQIQIRIISGPILTQLILLMRTIVPFYNAAQHMVRHIIAFQMFRIGGK